MLALRQRNGLTQVELAAAAGVLQTSIGAWEWSPTPPRSRDLSRLADALGVEVGDLVALQGVETGRPAKAKAPRQ
ncbi:MAG: helix-turn-helix transcriptional regulator [Myxococcota bacterium]